MRLGGVVGVVAASALAAVAAAGPPLYVSSSASAAVQVQAERTCGADLGLRVFVPAEGEGRRVLAEGAAALDHVAPPIETLAVRAATFKVAGRDDGVQRRITLLHRPGQERELGPSAATLGPNDALLPDWAIEQLGLRMGDELEVGTPARRRNDPAPGGGTPTAARLRLVGGYPAVPVQPPSSFWCGLVNDFKPTAQGDYPDPVALVSAETLAPLAQSWVPFQLWELRATTDGITRDEAASLVRRLDALVDDYLASEPRTAGLPRSQIAVVPRLGAVVARSEQVAATVSRTVGPVTLAGAVATAAVLVASALLLARARRRELRLLAVRGVPSPVVWARLARSLAAPVAAGIGLGFGVAVLAVARFGPTDSFEPRLVRRAAASTAAAGLIALGLLVGVAASSARQLVDAPAVHRRRLLRWVPWELGAVALAILSYRRLDRFGGVQLLGAKAYGGDVLAQAYPLLLLVAALVVVARPVSALTRRLRFVGRRWRPSLQLGVRRVVAEPGVSVGLVLATALAVASLVSARVLTDSAVQALRDKARTYVGSDLAVRTDGDERGLTAALAARTTTVARQDVRFGSSGTAQLLGIDPETFARAAAWRGDEAPMSLAAVLARLRAPVPAGAVAAIVVGGPLGSNEVTGPGGARLTVVPVLALETFPGFHNPGPVLVVDRAALARSALSSTFELWFRSPPADVLAQVRAADRRVYSASGVDEVFDVSSFLAVRWSYALLGAFGVVVGAVTALAQLLVLDARRRSRQAAYVLTVRMGLGPRAQFVSLLTEVGVPVVLGVVGGFGLGVASGRTSVARLDTLRNLQPVTRPVVAVPASLAILGATLLTAVVLAAWGLAALARTRPMEVLRETA
jgi:hypothetical protein